MTIIRCENLSLALGDRQVLSDIHFQVDAGAFVAVIGPNGAGKSSLLKCLMGIHRNWLGDLVIDGRDFREMKQRELAAVIGYVPQDVPQPPAYTVTELVKMSRYARSRRRHDRVLIAGILERLNLAHLAERQLLELSGGERRRAYIAAALAQEPKVLLLDEPMTFLDPKQRWEVIQLLSNIHREEAITIFIVTHGMDENLPAHAQVLGLREGHLRFQGSREQLLQDGILKALFDIHHRPVAHPYTGAPIPIFGGTP